MHAASHRHERKRNRQARELTALARTEAQRAARNAGHRVPIDDLFGAAMLGLARAFDRFSPEVGAPFKSFALSLMRWAILDHLRMLDPMSRPARSTSRQLLEAESELSAELGRPATDAEMAGYLEVSIAEYHRLRAKSACPRFVALEDAAQRSSGSMPDPHQCAERRELGAWLRDHVDALPPRQRSVIVWYYYEGLPLKEIAKRLSVTSARICQIRSAAVEMLRKQSASVDDTSAPRHRRSCRRATSGVGLHSKPRPGRRPSRPTSAVGPC